MKRLRYRWKVPWNRSKRANALGRCLPLLLLILLVAAACGGVEAPRIAVELPRGPSGPSDSPAVQAAFAVQGALNLPASQATMRVYLGNRYAGDWIINNGKTGVLNVGVVQLTPADKAYARKHIHMGSGASIRLINEKYSMRQLTSFQAKVSRYVESHSKGKVLEQHPFVGFGPSDPDNAVELRVSKRDAAYWIPRIQPLLPYDAFVVQYTSVRTATAARQVTILVKNQWTMAASAGVTTSSI
jgi:hypothetical protein